MSNVPWSWPGSVVTRVVDGDSFWAKVTRDVGFHGELRFDVKLRLNRINAYPISTAMGFEASTRVKELVGLAIAMPLHIETTKPYKYGDEWMAEVTLPDGRNLSDILVAEGLALYWNGTGPRPGG